MAAEPSVAEARALVEARFPDVRVRTCEPVLGGWDHVLLRVNGDWMFRVPRRTEAEASLEKEARLLPELAPALPVAVPRYERLWRGRARPRILAGYRRIPGRPLSASAVVGAHGASLCRPIAGFLTALHAFPVGRATRAGVPAGDAETWRREYDAFFRRIRKEAFPFLRSGERSWATEMCEAFLAEEGHFRFAPVLLHRDLVAEHVLHDPRSHRITGVIDWGDASVGDPAFDFTGPLADLGAPAARAILAAYRGPRDPGMLERATFYGSLSPFYGIIYGRRLGHPEWTRIALRQLRARIGSG